MMSIDITKVTADMVRDPSLVDMINGGVSHSIPTPGQHLVIDAGPNGTFDLGLIISSRFLGNSTGPKAHRYFGVKTEEHSMWGVHVSDLLTYEEPKKPLPWGVKPMPRMATPSPPPDWIDRRNSDRT
jgi:hypothetical protein